MSREIELKKWLNDYRMVNFISLKYEKHKIELEKRTSMLLKIVDSLTNKQTSDTTSLQDCRLLQLLCLENNFKKVSEIGTWIGTTSYAMSYALNDDSLIYTCDNNNEFVDLNNEASKKIIINPNTWSTNFLKNKDVLGNTDMFFNDASLSDEDANLIYDLANKNFIFSTHDFYNSNGGYEKGYDAIQKMLKVLEEKQNKNFELYLPRKEWYNGGHNNEINGCTAFIQISKG